MWSVWYSFSSHTHTRIISASASYYNHHGYLLGLPGDENVVKKPNNIHALHTDH